MIPAFFKKRRSIVLLVAACAVAALVFYQVVQSEPEPQYNGKKLSQWVDIYELSLYPPTVDADPRWNLEAKREDRFYEEASGPMATFISVLGTAISIFFAFGATLGAMITMYAQVAGRVREVGTLRALGFKRRSVLWSFLVESFILALLGAAGGCALASLLSAATFTTTNFGSFTEIKFRFHFALEVALKATLFAVVMGLLGGLLPAARAARLQIAEATKG